MKNTLRTLFFTLIFTCLLLPIPASAEGFNPELDASMLTQEQKNTITAEGKSIEDFISKWQPWWRACLSSAGEKEVYVNSTLHCEGHPFFEGSPGGHANSDPVLISKPLTQPELLTLIVTNRNTAALDPIIGSEVARSNAKANGAGVIGQWVAGTAGGAAGVLGVPAGMIDAVTNPNGQIDRMVNQLKKDGVQALSLGLQYITHTMSFNASATWFRSSYAAAAGVGLRLVLLTLR